MSAASSVRNPARAFMITLKSENGRRREMQNLKGKYAIVTGSGKGIGEAIVKKFLEEEIAGVAMLEWNESLVNETAARLDPSGKRLLPLRCDVSNWEDVKAAVARVLEEYKTVDILVNNAGITRDAMFHKMTEEQWNQVISVNLNALFYSCKEVVPTMREKQYGKIINVSSISALGNIGQANYASSKAAVQGFTKTLAKELGSKGINVNAVAPGYIMTDMVETIPEDICNNWINNFIPLHRFGSPAETASVVCFLASDESSYISSQCIYVCGGATTG